MEAGFIEKDDVRLPLVGLAENASQFIALPAFDLLVVAFAGLASRLLAGPTQTLFEDFTHVFRVEGDAQALLDKACHAIGGPQLVGPAVFLGTLQQKAFEFAEMVVGKSWRGAGQGPGVQAVGFLGHASPAMYRGSADTEDAGDDGRGLALFDEFDGAATAAFEFSGCSFRSHTVLYTNTPEKGIFSRTGLSRKQQLFSSNGRSSRALTMCSLHILHNRRPPWMASHKP